jgi:hypothetical protein
MVYGLALATLRAWRRWRNKGLDELVRMSTSPWLLCWLFISIYTAIHLASWANVRYRLPVDAFLILFAALAIDHLLQRCSALCIVSADTSEPPCSRDRK